MILDHIHSVIAKNNGVAFYQALICAYLETVIWMINRF